MLALVLSLAASWPAVSTDVPAFGLGANDAAVVAGVSRPFVLPEVKGAVENATDWYTWLTRARGVPLEQVHLLRDGEVTRERLLAAAAAARAQVKPGGAMWIVFVGHGAPAPSGDDGLLLGVDAQRTELSLRERGLPQRELLAAARGEQAVTIAVFDACFSGMAADGRTPLVEGSQATLPLRRAEEDDSVVVLSSSEEIAGPLPGHDRPAFSYLLLGAMRGWADADGDARVTLHEAFGWTRQTLITVVRDRNQSPTLRGASTNVVVAAMAREAAPDLARLIAAPRAPAGPPVAVVDGGDRARLEEAFRRREIRLDPKTKEWRRGDFPSPLARADLLFSGRDGAPAAVAALEEIERKESVATLAWVLPPVAGMALGAAAGVGAGALYIAANNLPADDQDRPYILGGFFGSFAGAAVATLAVSLPVGLWAQIGEEEKRQIANAEAELATAANAVEREKLGLPP